MLLLNAATVIVLAILAGVLFFRKNNVLPNKILAVILIVPALNFLSNVITLSGNLAEFPLLYFIAQTTGFVFAPLVHMYVLLMTGEQINRRHPLYVVPALAILTSLLFIVDFAFAMSPGEKQMYFERVLQGPYPYQMMVINSIFILLQQVYFTVAAIHVYKYRNRLAQTVSNYETTKVEFVTIFIGLIWTLNIITIAAYIILPTIHVEYIVLPLVLSIIAGFILYYAFRHDSIFSKSTYRVFLSTNLPLKRTPTNPSAPIDLEHSADPLYSGEKHPTVPIIQHLDNYLASTAAYTYSELKLSTLSKETGISEQEITEAIQQSSSKNFYNYINEKRIQKALLLNKSFNNLEKVARESGFQNREALEKALRKFSSSSS